MEIAIIGHGNVGGALAHGWASKGHTLRIGVRNKDDRTNRLAELPHTFIVEIEEAIQQSEVILVATPAHVCVDLAKAWKGKLTNKVLIDATNAVSVKPEPYRTALEAFKAEGGASEVVKCFNTTGFENMLNPVYGGVGIDMFVAGNSVKAKNIATQLAQEIGFGEVYDFGGDDKAELLEQFALGWINLAIMQGYGRDIAIKFLKRK